MIALLNLLIAFLITLLLPAIDGCRIPSVLNGYIESPSKFLPGDLAQLYCESGYSLSPPDAKNLIRCNSDGSIGSFDDAPLSCEG